MKTLRECTVGSKVIVRKIHGTGPLKQRLMDMGIVRQAKLQIYHVAPLGDPIEIRLRGYALTLRKDELDIIEVE